ncbi:MAG: TetR family transcriptional regulator [Rhizobiales bacterium]|nr:TetR family transcriptional regulator [Hyphomicrobiales bacterium]
MEPDDARSQWIDAGLRALRRDGVEAVRVERLAVDLGKTKGSFYWHFADRKALLAALLEAWRGRATQAVIEDVESAGGDARARLATLMATTLAADGRLERAMRDWARGDAAVAAAMAGIDDRRLRYVAELLVGAGVAPADAKLRARFAYQSLIGRFVMAADPPERAGRSARSPRWSTC